MRGGGGNLLDIKKECQPRAKAHTFFKELKAFTLAEVLVTLTILGILASIIVPNLIQQSKKTQTVTRLKMAYSLISNIVEQSYIENGYLPIVDYDGDTNISAEEFNTYFGKYLNIDKNCGMSSGSMECFGDKTYNLGGTQVDQAGYSVNSFYQVLLKNGISVGVSKEVSSVYGHRILVDIDGPNKGDSKYGQDLFLFNYYAPNQNIRDSLCPNVGLYFSESQIKTKECKLAKRTMQSSCGSSNTGYFCAGRIANEGWKISSGYPWAKAQKKP